VAGKLIPIFGLPSNAGNPVYAAVTVVVAVAVAKHGADAAKRLVWRTLAMLVVGHVIFLFANVIPVAAGNEVPSAALKTVTGPGLRIVVASFLAFALSQFIAIAVFTEGRSALGYVVAAFLAQIVDSVVFFPAAFYKSSIAIPNVTAILSGIGIKTALCLTAVPVVWACLRRDATSERPETGPEQG